MVKKMLGGRRFWAALAVASLACLAWSLMGTHSGVSITSDGNASGSDGPRVGSPAPGFVLASVHGQSWNLGQHRGHPIVLAFFCGCNRCHRAARKMAALQRRHALPGVVSVVALVPGAAQEFARETGLQGVVLSDPADDAVGLYGSEFCPRLWGVSSAGVITYRSPPALEGADVTAALCALQSAPRKGPGPPP